MDSFFQQDHAKANQIRKQAAELGSNRAHCRLGHEYHKGGDLKKAKFHWEAAAMAGNEDARCGLGLMEFESGNMERAVKHLTIATSAGDPRAMHELILSFEAGHVSKESINSTLTAYNNSCTEMRSEARDAFINTAIMRFANSMGIFVRRAADFRTVADTAGIIWLFRIDVGLNRRESDRGRLSFRRYIPAYDTQPLPLPPLPPSGVQS